MLSIVVPVHNESAIIADTLESVLRILDDLEGRPSELLVVDDGSDDGTTGLVREFCDRDDRVGLLRLARRQGKESAIQAGLEHARGEAVVVMDGDLQHPPTLITQMLDLWRAGALVVEGVKHRRQNESWMARMTASCFYRFFDRLTGIQIKDHTDFKLLDRQVVDAYLELPERRRFFRGLVAWLAFPSAQIPFDVPDRADGRRSFGTTRRLGLSAHAISSFSSAPLHLMSILGGAALLLGASIGSITLWQKITGQAVDGFATVILTTLILGGLTMMGLGLIGLYLASIFDEVKGRPTYVLDSRSGHLPASEDSPSSRDQ